MRQDIYAFGPIRSRTSPGGGELPGADEPEAPAAEPIFEATIAPSPAVRRPAAGRRRPRIPHAVTRSLSLFIPGAGHFVHGRPSLALFFLATAGFAATLAWAILTTFERLAQTLPLLGSTIGAAFVALGVCYGTAATIHLAGVLTTLADEPAHPPTTVHPAIPGVASLLLPGWGQALNGDRFRAVLFLAGAWIVGAIWIASAPASSALFNRFLPVVGPVEQLLRQPTIVWMAKWTAPLLVWSLAIYDAVASASARRRTG